MCDWTSDDENTVDISLIETVGNRDYSQDILELNYLYFYRSVGQQETIDDIWAFQGSLTDKEKQLVRIYWWEIIRNLSSQ